MRNYRRVLLGTAAFAAVALGLFLFFASGKSPPPDAVSLSGTATQGRFTAIGYLFGEFVKTRHRSPASFEELVQFGKQLPFEQGGPIEFTEAFVTSPRDMKPIVIIYGLGSLKLWSGQKNGGKDGPIVAHEQSGVGGRRFVVFLDSNRVTELTEAEFKKNIQN
jgi:hypothetical protein